MYSDVVLNIELSHFEKLLDRAKERWGNMGLCRHETMKMCMRGTPSRLYCSPTNLVACSLRRRSAACGSTMSC